MTILVFGVMRFFHLGSAQDEGVVRERLDEDWRSAGVFHHVRIAHPVRSADDDFVSRINQRAHRIENRSVCRRR